MYERASYRRAGLRRLQLVCGALLTACLIVSSAGTLLAGTTGAISGTVLESATRNPLPGVTVTAVSPTGRYHGTTDAKGFYSFIGVSPDTYAISAEFKGYQPETLSGVTVVPDQVAVANVTMQKSLRTIGQVTARSAGGAFQPTQAINTYTVTASQIATQLGKANAVSETQLLASLPGASLDSSGYPVLRGGRENEEGFEFEGIDYTDAFTSQFINTLALNPGISSLQLTPGPGDATVGNAGTGVINLVAKRGTYPAFGSGEALMSSPAYGHEVSLEYGVATANGRLSSYTTFKGTNDGSQFGYPGTAAYAQGHFFGPADQISHDFVENLVYKMGPNLNQSLQFLVQNEIYTFKNPYGGYTTNGGQPLYFKTNDPYFLANAEGFTGLGASTLQSLFELDPYQKSETQTLGRSPEAYYQPNDTYKLQYSNNLDASTFFTAKYYRSSAVVRFDFPFDGQSVIGFPGFVLDQGGQRSGFALDATKQLNSKNLLQFGGKYEYLHPIYNQVDPLDGFWATVFSGQVYDFVNPSACASSPSLSGACGYLYKYFPNGPGPIPRNNEATVTNRQDMALYVSDTYDPTSKLKINAGVRLDGVNYRMPGDFSQYAPSRIDPNGFPIGPNGPVTSDTQPYFFTSTGDQKTPRVVEPRLSFAYQIGTNDAIRASYGRSVEFPPLAFVDLTNGNVYGKFAKVPATAPICGVTANLTCQNYADQLQWANQDFLEGVPIQPVLPETFNNLDFSYSHQFPHNIGLKITPFYRRGYNATALVASPRLGPNGQPILNPDGTVVTNPAVTTNLGVNKTTGAEFLVTKESQYGISGSFSATYINEFSNVIPDSGNEDFFPSIPPQSLALGNLYRVGFLSPFQATLALQYKTKNGWRFNPIISYNKGYPLGEGTITAIYVNGKPYNVINTNVTDPNGSSSASSYVDPTNPGSVFHPNIVGTRGTPEGASAGGFLSAAEANVNMTVEYSPPRSRSTFGVLVGNVFGSVYSNAILTNTRYQPVATGISGPNTGWSGTVLAFPSLGSTPYYPMAQSRGQDPYLIRPSGSPAQWEFYYQLHL